MTSVSYSTVRTYIAGPSRHRQLTAWDSRASGTRLAGNHAPEEAIKATQPGIVGRLRPYFDELELAVEQGPDSPGADARDAESDLASARKEHA